MPEGIVCMFCKKVIREHTRKIYVPVKYRDKPGEKFYDFNWRQWIVVPHDQKENLKRGYILASPQKKWYRLSYCSDDCKQKHIEKKRKTVRKRSKEKYPIKKEIFERDRSRCILCHSKDRIEIAHFVPFRETQTFTLDNCALLCWNCHQIFDNKSNNFLKKRNRITYSGGRYKYKKNTEFERKKQKIRNLFYGYLHGKKPKKDKPPKIKW